MNKKFSKAAALSIAAVTAISAMALPASAWTEGTQTITKPNGTHEIVKTVSGTIYKISWYFEETVYTYNGADDTTTSATPTIPQSGDFKESTADYYSDESVLTTYANKAKEWNNNVDLHIADFKSQIAGNSANTDLSYLDTPDWDARTVTYKKYRLVSSSESLNITAMPGITVGSTMVTTTTNNKITTTAGDKIVVVGGSTGGGTGTGTGGGTGTINPGIGTYYPTTESERLTPGNLSYLGANGKFYTTYTNAHYYGGGAKGSISNNWSTYSNSNDTVYFDALDGQYYLTSGTYRYVVKKATYYSSSYGSYLSSNGLYYPTISAAKNASFYYNGSSYYSTKASTASARYLSMNTGYFYDTYSAALAASTSSSYVIDLANYSGSSYTYNYNNPYYYYPTTTTTKIDPDAATIYGSSKKSGWTVIKKYINYASKNTTVKIDMKKQTSVPSSILAAAKSRGVNLQLILPNGVKWTISYKDIADTNSALDITTTYNMKVIPNSIVKKAKKANKNVVSTAQIKIGGSSYLPAAADVTVKLPAKRSGCTVKAYRYTSSGSLKLVDTSKVTNTGAVTLDIQDGGYYLLVVCD